MKIFVECRGIYRDGSHKENNINIKSVHYNLQILNIDHQLQVQLSSLMWDYDHDTLPITKSALQKGKSCT